MILDNTYTIESIKSDGRKIVEVYELADFYYVLTLNKKNVTSFWRVDKNTKSVAVTSWPKMIIETKGTLDDHFMIPVDRFIKAVY